jgi:hypothetical protein
VFVLQFIALPLGHLQHAVKIETFQRYATAAVAFVLLRIRRYFCPFRLLCQKMTAEHLNKLKGKCEDIKLNAHL